MTVHIKKLFAMAFCCLFIFSLCSAYENEPEEFVFDIPEGHPMSQVLEELSSLVEFPKEESESFLLVANWDEDKEKISTMRFIANKNMSVLKKQPVGLQRDYNYDFNPDEKNDLSFIVTTLANCTLTKIWKNKSALEKAGDRIDHVHPLKFLMAIFNDEQLKVGLHVIKTRGWVWKDFFGGIRDSLETESKLGNLTLVQIEDFSSKLGIDASLILPAIEGHKWNDFVDILIKHLPRLEDGGRYDI